MRILPASSASELALAGSGIVIAGAVLSAPAIVAWGAALLIGLSLARAATAVRVLIVRSSGLEMTWGQLERVTRVYQGAEWQLTAELCNRDNRAVRFAGLRALCPSELEIQVSPRVGEVPAQGTLRLSLIGRCCRVGSFGVWGIGLELRGQTGLFEVPLTFASPVGVAVLMKAPVSRQRRATIRHANAGGGNTARGRRRAPSGELAELRDHQAGDSFKSIAWKASARRGRLVSRTFENLEQRKIWFVLDASVELWAGKPGSAPLDLAIAGVCHRAYQLLDAGEQVGLTIVHGGRAIVYEARGGRAQWGVLQRALSRTPNAMKEGRSGLDELGLTRTVLEHMSLISPRAAHGLRVEAPKAVAKLGRVLAARGPFFEPRLHNFRSETATLFEYLASYGVPGPPRLQGEAQATQAAIALVLKDLRQPHKRVTEVTVASPLPDEAANSELVTALRKKTAHGPRICWLHSRDCVRLDAREVGAQAAEIAAKLAMEVRVQRGEKNLRKWGVRQIECLDLLLPLEQL